MASITSGAEIPATISTRDTISAAVTPRMM